MDFKDIEGLTLSAIDNTGDEILFTTTCGRTFKQHHWQDCCESVIVEDVVGDFSDLIGHPILRAEERSNYGDGEYDETQEWTFYELATIKGSVTIRWYGTSNGYYSTAVSFEEVK